MANSITVRGLEVGGGGDYNVTPLLRLTDSAIAIKDPISEPDYL